MFGVCCNNTLPVELPEEPSVTEDTKVDEESEAIVEEFPVADAVRRNCGFRSVRPRVTLYNQSPVPAPFLYHQAIAQPYIVNGEEAIAHEFPFMVDWLMFLLNKIVKYLIPGRFDESQQTVLRWFAH